MKNAKGNLMTTHTPISGLWRTTRRARGVLALTALLTTSVMVGVASAAVPNIEQHRSTSASNSFAKSAAQPLPPVVR